MLQSGLDRIRADLDIPSAFPPELLAAAERAARRAVGAEHVDRTDRRFVTLDPASSVDLDQAFDVELAGDDVVLHRYVIEAVLAVARGRAVPSEVDEAFGRLPAAMARAEQVLNRAERLALDLAEASSLVGREGGDLRRGRRRRGGVGRRGAGSRSGGADASGGPASGPR